VFASASAKPSERRAGRFMQRVGIPDGSDRIRLEGVHLRSGISDAWLLASTLLPFRAVIVGGAKSRRTYSGSRPSSESILSWIATEVERIPGVEARPTRTGRWKQAIQGLTESIISPKPAKSELE